MPKIHAGKWLLGEIVAAGPAIPRGVCSVRSHPTWTPADGLSVSLILRLLFAYVFLMSCWRPRERREKGPDLGLTHPSVQLLLRPLFGKRPGGEFPRGCGVGLRWSCPEQLSGAQLLCIWRRGCCSIAEHLGTGGVPGREPAGKIPSSRLQLFPP